VRYAARTDREALDAFALLSRTEGIIPALEPAHAIAELPRVARDGADQAVLVCLSGRGDKDLDIVRGAVAPLPGAPPPAPENPPP
jgi:tryptophan synthase beta chain